MIIDSLFLKQKFREIASVQVLFSNAKKSFLKAYHASYTYLTKIHIG